MNLAALSVFEVRSGGREVLATAERSLLGKEFPGRSAGDSTREAWPAARDGSAKGI